MNEEEDRSPRGTPPRTSGQTSQPLRARVGGFVAVSVIAVTSLALGFLGFQNARTAYSYPGRLLGATLLLLGIALFATFVTAMRRATSTGTSNFSLLLGSIGSLAASIFIAITTITTSEYWWPRVISSVLIAGAAFATFYSSGIGQDVSYPRRFEIATLVAAAIAVGNFGYSQLYEPSARPTKVDISATIGDRIPSTDGSVSFPLNIKLHNIGEVDISVVAATYSVLGRSATPVENPHEVDNTGKIGVDELGSQVDIKDYTMIQADAWLPNQAWLKNKEGPWSQDPSWLNQGEKIQVIKVVKLATPEKFDELAANVQATIIRRDKAIVEELEFERSSEPPQWVKDTVRANDVSLHGTWTADLAENDWTREQLRKPRRLIVWWIFPERTLSPLQHMIAVDGQWRGSNGPSPKDLLKMYENYGLVRLDSGWSEKSLSHSR